MNLACCGIDLTLPGMMRDVLSNALVRGLGKPEDERDLRNAVDYGAELHRS